MRGICVRVLLWQVLAETQPVEADIAELVIHRHLDKDASAALVYIVYLLSDHALLYIRT